MIYTAAIIGLGNIGQGYDYHLDDHYCLTHAKAYAQHPGFNLIAGVDLELPFQSKFKQKYGVTTFNTVSDLLKHTFPDVVSICVPTQWHFEIFHELIGTYQPKAILFEKPFGTNLKQARVMQNLAKKSGCSILVNYIRRFEPGVIQCKNLFDNKHFGILQKGIVRYTKGVLSNGVHFIDLCNFLFGSPLEIEIIKNTVDDIHQDYQMDFYIKYKDIEIYFICVTSDKVSIFEADFYTENAKISYHYSGGAIHIQNLQSSTIFQGSKVFSPDQIEIVSSDLTHYQHYVVDSLYQHLHAHVFLPSTAETAIETHQVVSQLIQKTYERTLCQN